MRVAVLALALIALAACQEDAPTPAADPLALIGTGTEWTVTEIAGAAVPEGIRVTLLSPEPGMIAGSSGCNRYSGRIETRDGALHVGALAGTRMMCPPEQMQVEQAFHSTIGTVTGLQLADQALDFTDTTGKVVLRAAR
ncbi:META domain-containing protein [Rhodobacter capsulatus]|uniref:META domain-containing protein n=1 Tax=Rhodobacter capsulatus TaxID=1061 RepID=UPI00402979A5